MSVNSERHSHDIIYAKKIPVIEAALNYLLYLTSQDLLDGSYRVNQSKREFEYDRSAYFMLRYIWNLVAVFRDLLRLTL